MSIYMSNPDNGSPFGRNLAYLALSIKENPSSIS